MIDFNLQLFGGRGAGARIARKSEKAFRAIVNVDGVQLIYEQQGNSVVEVNTGNEIPLPMDEVIARVKAHGATVETQTREEYEKKHRADRDATDKVLDAAYVRDRIFVKGSSDRRKSNRAARRIRR